MATTESHSCGTVIFDREATLEYARMHDGLDRYRVASLIVYYNTPFGIRRR